MFRKILVPIDLQETKGSEALLKVADQIAEQFQSELHILTVMPGYSMPIVAGYFPADAKATAKQALEEQLKSLVADQLKNPAVISVHEGRRGEVILATAKQYEVDLILIGQHVGRVEDALLGSVGTTVAQRAACSVMVVRV